MRVLLTVLCLTSALPIAAQELPERYVRGDVGLAVEVPWVGARAGWIADEGKVGLDLGLSGSPRDGIMALTGGFEARGAPGSRVSPFLRTEVGGMVLSEGQFFGVVSLGGGLAVRVHRSWALRGGLMYSLHLGDLTNGPDYLFVGLERRW
jgi:hypothetical protein